MIKLQHSLLVLVLGLTACEQVSHQLGIEDPARKEAIAEAEGKAVGGACRQSGRAIEDCYSIYSWLPKAAVFSGWRDMDAYMRENQLETIEPQLPPPEPPGKKKKKDAESDESTSSGKSGNSKAESKAADKH